MVIKNDESPRQVSKKVKEKLKNGHVARWNEIPQHSYVFNKQKQQENYNEKLSRNCQ